MLVSNDMGLTLTAVKTVVTTKALFVVVCKSVKFLFIAFSLLFSFVVVTLLSVLYFFQFDSLINTFI